MDTDDFDLYEENRLIHASSPRDRALSDSELVRETAAANASPNAKTDR